MIKKLTIFLLLISTSTYSQYSKNELKIINKAGIKIVNRGLDLNAVFVPYTKPNNYGVRNSTVPELWKESLFEVGLDVGTWFKKTTVKDAENREMILQGSILFKGRYNFEIGEGCNYFRCIKIYDLQNENKLVSTISWKFDRIYGNKFSFLRRYVLEELIRLN